MSEKRADSEDVFAALAEVEAKAWKTTRAGKAFQVLKAELLRARSEEERLRSILWGVQDAVKDADL